MFVRIDRLFVFLEDDGRGISARGGGVFAGRYVEAYFISERRGA